MLGVYRTWDVPEKSVSTHFCTWIRRPGRDESVGLTQLTHQTAPSCLYTFVSAFVSHLNGADIPSTHPFSVSVSRC